MNFSSSIIIFLPFYFFTFLLFIIFAPTMTYEELWHRLTHIYDAGEAKAIVRWVLDVRFAMSLTDILCGKVTELSAHDQTELEKIMQRLEKGEPVQYIIGVADFFGRQFHVAPGVLIPRPETEELCRWIISQKGQSPLCDILDIGTGSGCIAVTLALELPDVQVTAWDISDDALRIAAGNAKSLGANVTFEHRDALDSSLFTLHSSLPKWDLIVSNPPYICEKEKSAMECNVLEHEPHLALFVPDDDPLLFYRAIAQYAIETLKPQGSLFFEINPLYADDLAQMLHMMPYHDISIRQDQFGKARFLKATKI
jgi:release factor glutamine methyltransferase